MIMINLINQQINSTLNDFLTWRLEKLFKFDLSGFYPINQLEASLHLGLPLTARLLLTWSIRTRLEIHFQFEIVLTSENVKLNIS